MRLLLKGGGESGYDGEEGMVVGCGKVGRYEVKGEMRG